ncbi:MAG: efflux RND transporter periplasmic adaptor subunit [Acidobacteria bacterium]|nr:efflux RND transporter periplasmic adaptor subunit [Acidobacteriota bacterium]
MTRTALLAVLLVAGCTREKQPDAVHAVAKPDPKPERGLRTDAKVEVEAAQVVSLPEAIRAPGRIVLNDARTWRVGAVVDGRVMEAPVQLGDSVKRGQILARMHSHEVHEGRASYQKALSELARWKAQEAQARRARDRAKTLFGLKAASAEQVEHAETELRSVEEAIRQAGYEIERTRIHLVEFLDVPADDPDHGKAGDAGDWVPVKSPADGMVMERLVTPGSVVQPGGAMFVIADMSMVWMVAAVAEEHYSKLHSGMPARVRVKAHGDRVFAGRVGRLGEQLDPATRTVQARIEIANPGGALKPEMYADAELELRRPMPVLMIPEPAIQEVKDQQVVFVRKGDGHYETVAVETGRVRDGRVEIVHGLTPGDQVVTRGAFTLKSQMLKKSLEEE